MPPSSCPLNMSRSFDTIFKGVGKCQAMECFIQYYDKFRGSVNTCLCLYNSYLHYQICSHHRGSNECHDQEGHQRKVGVGGIFRSKKVMEFLTKFDYRCHKAMELVFITFLNHFDPIVNTKDMEESIAQ